MKKRSLHFLTLISASFIATSCSLFSNLEFDWLKATNNNTEINYCLLIGQNEHSDSIERTRWTREALGTRDAKTEINGNANLGIPKQGKLELGEEGEKTTFTVNELEHMEQKSLAGVVWDSITANSTTATWINKHSDKLTMIISNNDGMAEGALHAYNYTKGLPIFGYDANSSTLELIKEYRDTGYGIMGTVDQLASVQTATSFMTIRNILDDQDAKTHDIGTPKYKPTNRGFNKDNPNNDVGLYIDGFACPEGEQSGVVDPDKDERSPHNLDLKYNDGYHEILSKSVAIDKDTVEAMLDDKGKVRKPEDLAWDPTLGYVHETDKPEPSKNAKRYEVCLVCNNSAEVYLQGTMMPYYNSYNSAFNLDIHKIDGDGISEQTIFNQLEAYCSRKSFDAFLINMVTTTDGEAFVSKLAEYAANKEGKSFTKGGWNKWEDRLNTPLLFWNKQPQTVQGTVDTDVMNNKYFKYTYFVGVDAAYGGKEQGKMIVNYLNQRYLESIGKNNYEQKI